MIIREEGDVKDLPAGIMWLRKDDALIEVNMSDDYATAAARIILEHNDHTSFVTQAEVAERAINKYRWGLGKRGYTAHLSAAAVVEPTTVSMSR